MSVRVAKSAGFCFGVSRAVELVEQAAKAGKKVVTLGPIIHNHHVVDKFRALGVEVIDTPEQACPGQTVIIRSHGVSRAVYEELQRRGVEIIDATCPFVKRIHGIVSRAEEEGQLPVIIGTPTHPEVEGIRGWGNRDTKVVENEAEAEDFNLSEGQKLCIVSQTTFNYNKFKELVEILCKKRYDNSVLNMGDILNTICNATEERQKEAQNIAGEVDTMLVIGGRHSSNTQKLFEICKEECGNTYYIQTPVDLDSEMFHHSSYVGITAGASTPKKIIEEVQEHVRIEF